MLGNDGKWTTQDNKWGNCGDVGTGEKTMQKILRKKERYSPTTCTKVIIGGDPEAQERGVSFEEISDL